MLGTLELILDVGLDSEGSQMLEVNAGLTYIVIAYPGGGEYATGPGTSEFCVVSETFGDIWV